MLRVGTEHPSGVEENRMQIRRDWRAKKVFVGSDDELVSVCTLMQSSHHAMWCYYPRVTGGD